jgi:hypothetical protein
MVEDLIPRYKPIICGCESYCTMKKVNIEFPVGAQRRMPIIWSCCPGLVGPRCL